MKSTQNLDLSILRVNAPNYWPSLSIVYPAQTDSFSTFFNQFKDYDILSSESAPINKNLWLVPVGQMQPYLLAWLKRNFPNPYKRPRTLFFLGGEGAKLCHHLITYSDVFRIDDEWIVSSDVEKSLVDQFVPGNNRTSVLWYPVKNIFRPLSESDQLEVKKELNLPVTQKLLLYAGRISTQKNIVSLLDFIEKFPELTLLICGDVDSIGFPHLEENHHEHLPSVLTHEIAKRKLTGRIIFKGFLSQEQLSKVMQVSDYQISLSAHYGEDFGYSIAQGLCSGLKTILSEWGGHLNWKSFLNDDEISYIPLDWENKYKGKPVLDSIANLPSRAPVNFSDRYHDKINKNLMAIVSNTEFQHRKPTLQFNEAIASYWEDHKNNPKMTMFHSKNDVLFRTVVENYSKPQTSDDFT